MGYSKFVKSSLEGVGVWKLHGCCLESVVRLFDSVWYPAEKG